MRMTRRCGGSQVVTGAPSGGVAPAAISIPVGNIQAATSAVIAVQTSSGAAGRSTSRVISNSRLMIWVPCFRDGGVQCDYEPVRATAGGGLVVVLRDEAVDGVRQLDGERGPVLRGREPHLAVDPECREWLAGHARAGDELTDLAHHAPRDREQPACGALVRFT